MMLRFPGQRQPSAGHATAAVQHVPKVAVPCSNRQPTVSSNICYQPHVTAKTAQSRLNCLRSGTDAAGGGLQQTDTANPTDYETWRKTMSPRLLAAMALSPVAALSLTMVSNQNWQESARAFGDSLRYRVQQVLSTEAFEQWSRRFDDGLTYMDWTAKWTGIDFSYIWDPELWVKFKEAVWRDKPQIFWNAFADRIEYKGIIPQQGLAGDMRISYSKFLQLLEADRVKRVIVYGDMKTAVVEVPHPWYASIVGAPGVYPFAEDSQGRPISLLVPNPEAPDDPFKWYCPEMPEWSMEKYRFYVDLPGDFWDRGTLLRYLRSKDVQVMWDAESRQYVLPRKAFTKVFQVRTEVHVLDPANNWEFLSWLTTSGKLEFYEKAAAFCLFCRVTSLILDWGAGTPIWRMWTTRKKKKKSKQDSMWERLTRSTAREFMTKDAKTGKLRDTGVRFEDIAGLDHIIIEMREVVKMLLNDPAYARVGAKVPRGIIFQGPPGTGKTYMARAIAGEAGVPFFSSVGSEFVEMFAGIAAARVNNLFVTARKRAPAIIFIDEIDAIGRARSQLGSDPGSMERESALLAMLVQMDGIHGKLESVLTIGATNLAQELDGALLRPGRFEVVYEIPSPGPVARMEILRYHSKNKKLAEPTLLTKVAEVTQGWSAASLANLMNEAAILTVRRNMELITLPLMMELVENINWGSRAAKIPPGEAKNRLAVVTAAKAVAFALTPGMEKIKAVTMWSRKRGLGPAVDFEPSEESLDVAWHPEMVEVMDYATNMKVNASTIGDQRLGEFLHVASLLVPLYAPRAIEVALWGQDAASLATAPPLSDCFQIGYWCVRNSQVHPRFKSLPPLMTNIWLGPRYDGREQRDSLASGFDLEFGYHKLTLTLLKASWLRAQRLVASRRTAIIKVAEAMLKAEDEAISGKELVAIIQETPEDDVTDLPELNNDFLPILKEVLGQVPGVVIDGEAAAPTLEIRPATTSSAMPAEPSTRTTASTAGRMGTTSFRGVSTASFERPSTSGTTDAGAASSTTTTGSTTTNSTGGRVGSMSFRATGSSGSASFQPPSASSSTGGTSTTTIGGPGGSSINAGAAGTSPEIRLTTQQLLDVSRAIMGRTDVVDLIGRNTAMEIAERVRDALLDPETVDRLQAVRRYMEGGEDAAFPPRPLAKDVPLPLYGKLNGSLEFWKQRQINTMSWSAMEMLYNPRQLNYYKDDADLPRDEDMSKSQPNPPQGPI